MATQSPSSPPPAGRLLSLDVFRGLVIVAMLTVNNIGDHSAVSPIFSHADWKPVSLKSDFTSWWRNLGHNNWNSSKSFPLLIHCTLADLVMPLFMLIIGVAIPFSTAAAKRRGNTGIGYWLGVIKRGLTLYLLGWIIGLSLQFLNWRFSDDPYRRLTFSLGMDVLQLLGASYIAARVLCILSMTPRLITAGFLLLWHWAFLRFYPQGNTPAGTFTEAHNAVGYAYSHWPIFRGIRLTSRVSFGIAGMLSVPPAAATMLLGSVAGETLLAADHKLLRMIFGGLLCLAIGIGWAFDLPMNKPRWTPCYLLYCSGIGMLGLALLYWLVDVKKIRFWTTPFVVLGLNAIGVYFLSILAKIWLLNMPKVTTVDGGEFFTTYLIHKLQSWTTPVTGSWIFTAAFVGTVWLVAALAYQKKLIWKV